MSLVYTEDWLSNDLNTMGYFFEHCDEMCKDYKGYHLNAIPFLSDFMNSKCRKAMEEGHTWLLSMDVYDVFMRYIDVDLNGDCSRYRSDVDTTQGYAFNQLTWVGEAYVHLHYELKLPSAVIVSVMPIEKMLDYYWTAHEIDIYRFIEKSLWLYQDKGVLPKDFKLSEPCMLG